MKSVLSAVLLTLLSVGLSAESLEEWAAARSSTKVADLTVGDWKAFADAQSIYRQELWYVHGSGFSSFVLPGVGQWKTGDVASGVGQMAGFVALTGATWYGAWALLPADLKSGTWNFRAWHDRFEAAWNDDPASLAPTLGVVAVGSVATLVYRFWSASDARQRAEANLDSGAVTFEPSFDGHFGGRWRF